MMYHVIIYNIDDTYIHTNIKDNVSRCFIFEEWPYQVVETGCALFPE